MLRNLHIISYWRYRSLLSSFHKHSLAIDVGQPKTCLCLNAMVLQLKLNSFFPLDLFVQHFNQTSKPEWLNTTPKKWNDRPTLWHVESESYLSTPTATLLQQTPQLPCWNPSWAGLAVSFPGPLLHGSPSFWNHLGWSESHFMPAMWDV